TPSRFPPAPAGSICRRAGGGSSAAKPSPASPSLTPRRSSWPRGWPPSTSTRGPIPGFGAARPVHSARFVAVVFMYCEQWSTRHLLLCAYLRVASIRLCVLRRTRSNVPHAQERYPLLRTTRVAVWPALSLPVDMRPVAPRRERPCRKAPCPSHFRPCDMG